MVLHLQLFNTQKYMIPFQYLSLGFILKIFLKFRKFQPHILIKYILIEKKSVSIETDIFFWNVFPPCNSYTRLVFEVERF